MLAILKNVAAAAQTGEAEGGFDIAGMIRHHLADSTEWEAPWGVVHLDRIPMPTFHLGPLTLDFTITKHVLFMMLAAVLVALVVIPAARRAKRSHEEGAHKGPKGGHNVVEAIILFLRDEVAKPNVGPHGERFYPYIIAVFFFVLFCNLLGLLPWGASPTGNVSVTAALAVVTFITVEVAGMRELGMAGYSKTIFFAPAGMSGIGKYLMLIIMTPVEFLGKLTKPFALAIRLYANMTAGHAVVLALTGLAVMAMGASAFVVVPAPIVMAVAIMILEIFVGFLQAYIFAMLSAVFIGLIRHAH